jgi:hypothetical protein
MGNEGREFVREHFLITRYLADYLRVFCSLSDLLPSNERATRKDAGA